MNTIGRVTVAIALLGSAAVLGCEGEGPESPPTVDIVAEDYEFSGPNTVRSGWVNLRMYNQGSEHHLFVLLGLPDGVTYGDFEREVTAVWDSMWREWQDGTLEQDQALDTVFRLMPDWYADRRLSGGVSLTAPGRTAETTVRLRPGLHVLECYVIAAEGRAHFMDGMTRSLVVVSEGNEAEPPAADQKLTVSNHEVMGVNPVSAGEQVFAVQFEENPDGYPQHLHLARLDGDTDADALGKMMNPDPVMPSPVEFLGGAQHMPAGETAYVTVELDSGRYGWLLGVPPNQGEIETFTVE